MNRMPELPEVETVCRGLRAAVVGRYIDEVVVQRPKIRIPVPEDLPERLQSAKITSVERRAKYILIHTDKHYSVLGHLGMSGKMMVFSELPLPLHKHDHIYFMLNDGQAVVFNDPRRFGLITGDRTSAIHQHPLLTGLGPEPLGDVFTPDYLYSKLSQRKQAIKVALMDQKLVVGVGNIYASEALHRAGINPDRSANLINKIECKELVVEIRNVLVSAIESGGSTLRDYVNSAGASGYFQHQFSVYDREGKGCLQCGTPITRITQAGRSTYYCAACQK
jgi:formamidopyrimidine-DNA glycosylase